MLKHRFSLIFFLTLALLGSQWVFAAHDHDGDWLHGDTDCPLCMHAVQFAAANAAPSVAAPLFVLLELGTDVPRRPLFAGLARLYDSRAPPHLL